MQGAVFPATDFVPTPHPVLLSRESPDVARSQRRSVETRVVVKPERSSELLAIWHDAVVAAELAERLASAASEAATQANLQALATRELAQLAAMASQASARAAKTAGIIAQQTAELETALEASPASVD